MTTVAPVDGKEQAMGHKKKINVVLGALACACLLMPIVSADQTPERRRTQGLTETDRFIKDEGQTSASVGTDKIEVQKTLTAYNTLVTQPSKNMAGDYKKLMKSMDSMNKRVTEATTKLGAMQGAGDTYFQG